MQDSGRPRVKHTTVTLSLLLHMQSHISSTTCGPLCLESYNRVVAVKQRIILLSNTAVTMEMFVGNAM
jgi:hypothetical protein